MSSKSRHLKGVAGAAPYSWNAARFPPTQRQQQQTRSRRDQRHTTRARPTTHTRRTVVAEADHAHDVVHRPPVEVPIGEGLHTHDTRARAAHEADGRWLVSSAS